MFGVKSGVFTLGQKGQENIICLQVKMSRKIEKPKSNENCHTLVQSTNPNMEQSITLYSIFLLH
jgi:hypothetical protein